MVLAHRFSLNIPAFLISFAVGILYIYLEKPGQKVVIKYPTPDTCGKIIYKDKSGSCFVYDAKKLDACPADKSQIKQHPISY